jgi:hypothetical protein
MDLTDLTDKIRKIEALIAGAASEGERSAAIFAKKRLQDKIQAQPIEYRVSLESRSKKKLFQAMCYKHGLSTYKYKGQKYTTAMVRVSKLFMDEVLWPEFCKYANMFDELTAQIVNDLIAKIHVVKEEDEIIISGELPLATEAATR